MKIFPLNEGLFTVDSTKVFVPFNKETDRMTDIPSGSVLLTVQPFLISVGSEIVLLDAGLGFAKDGQLQLIRALQKLGLKPDDVTKVILSHLHKDHTGGLGQTIDNGEYELNFPNATYYLQKRELDYALAQKGNASYHEPTLLGLSDHSQIQFLETDEGQINEHISYAVSGGHTPFHQVVWIREENETVLFAADELPRTVYVEKNYAYKNDYDGKKAQESRKQWIEQAQAENWTLLFYHDFKKAVMKLAEA